MNDHEHQLNASMSKSMVLMRFRNTILDDVHGGIEPVSQTGDFSDVVLTVANGGRTPWTEVSRIETEEMDDLIRQVVNRQYTFEAKVHDLRFVAMMDRALAEAWRCDESELDEMILSGTELSRRRTEERE